MPDLCRAGHICQTTSRNGQTWILHQFWGDLIIHYHAGYQVRLAGNEFLVIKLKNSVTMLTTIHRSRVIHNYMHTQTQNSNQFLLLSLTPPCRLIHETTHPTTQVSTAPLPPLPLLVWDLMILGFVADTASWVAD